MQKIVFAVNALRPGLKSLDFAAYLAGLTQSPLKGLFLQKRVYEAEPHLKTPFALAYVETITSEGEESAGERALVEQNIQLFGNACINRDVPFTTDIMAGNPLDELVDESRFADIILVNANTCFENGSAEGSPSKFVKNLLASAECPVFITPEGFEGADEIIFTYSGDESSVFAIKQFTYLFPQLATKKAVLLYVAQGQETDIRHSAQIADWLHVHYTNVHTEVLHGSPGYELLGKFINKTSSILVMGAFGRNIISQFFKQSTSELILKIINLPIFIAHK